MLLIGLFVQAFVATGADYHMAVITTTKSTIGSIINSNTPNAEVAIANEVIVGIGGSGMEMGLQKSHDALSNPNSAGPGGTFFRKDSTLIVMEKLVPLTADESAFIPDINYLIAWRLSCNNVNVTKKIFKRKI